MGKECKVSAIIPTYNERENLRPLLKRIAAVLRQYEVIIVDDGSPDGTGLLAEQLAAQYPVRCIHRSGKQGLGSAVAAGCAHARSEIIVVMDADLSHPPERIPVLVAHLKGSDIAIASRYCPGGRIAGWQAQRRLISRAAQLMCRPLTAVHDPLSGFFAIRRAVIRGMKLRTKGFKVLLEIILRGKGKRIVEVPYRFMDRKRGKSKLGVKEGVRYVKELAYLYGIRCKTKLAMAKPATPSSRG
ncbi:polyprenol monophosphomannose synthase [Candidatus Woesearchaeota archaeon]|nr:polyprenol monophosphomannose synthase [Candidatus Woesearchaeota archaeon]